MSALVISFYGVPGGAERRFARAFIRMRELGGQDKLIINEHGKIALEQVGVFLGNENVVVVGDFRFLGRFNALGKIFFVIRLWCHLLIGRYSHLHYPVDPSYVTLFHSFMGRLFAVGYSISVVDSTKVSKESFNRYSWFVWRRSIRFASRLDCLSESIANSVRSLFPKAPAIEVSPCSFTDYSRCRIAVERDFDIVLMSRLCAGKGIELFFEALALLRAQGRGDILGKIGIFGSGPLHGYVFDRVKEFSDFNFEYGYASDPFEILSRAKIFLSLQDKENYPSQSLLEAVACGALVIATDVGETCRIVSDEVGYRIPVNAQALADQLVVALARIKADQFDGSQTSKWIRETHTVERFSDYFSGFLRRAESPVVSGGQC